MPRKLPGIDGIPFYTDKPAEETLNVREEDLQLRGTAEVYVFDLSDSKQMEEYRKLQTDIARGLSAQDKEDVQFLSDKSNWKIFTKVLRYYYTLNTEEIIL